MNPCTPDRPPAYAGYVFDLDGTICRGDSALPGAVETLRHLRQRGARVAVMSNNALVSAQTHSAELVRMGFDLDDTDMFTSVTALHSHLRRYDVPGPLYVIGEQALRDHLVAEGFELSEDPSRIRCVVAALDRTFDYAKWTCAFHALRAGAEFIATNPDATYPIGDGEIPDCAGIIAALAATTGRTPSAVTGKPSAAFLSAVLDHLDVGADDVLIVGDRLATDVSMGVEHGVDTALVMTGVTTQDELRRSVLQPTYVLPSVEALLVPVSLSEGSRLGCE